MRQLVCSIFRSIRFADVIPCRRCDYLKAKSRRLGRTRPDQAPCSCGSLVYLGFDYSDFSDMPSDVRRWVKVLRVRFFSFIFEFALSTHIHRLLRQQLGEMEEIRQGKTRKF